MCQWLDHHYHYECHQRSLIPQTFLSSLPEITLYNNALVPLTNAGHLQSTNYVHQALHTVTSNWTDLLHSRCLVTVAHLHEIFFSAFSGIITRKSSSLTKIESSNKKHTHKIYSQKNTNSTNQQRMSTNRWHVYSNKNWHNDSEMTYTVSHRELNSTHSLAITHVQLNAFTCCLHYSWKAVCRCCNICDCDVTLEVG